MLTVTIFLLVVTTFGLEFEHSEIGVTLQVTKENEASYKAFLKSINDGIDKRYRSTFTVTNEQALLDLHNSHRQTTAAGSTTGQPSATNMNKLFWDDALATVASNYANQCIWGHNGNRNSETAAQSSLASWTQTSSDKIGENLYATSVTDAGQSDLLAGVTGWYEEYAFYDYTTTNCDTGEMCGHYTQEEWAETRYVGCGYANCPGGLSGWVAGTILVCNYFPAGNMNGNQPYESGSSCTNCEEDRTDTSGNDQCDSALCAGCYNPDYFVIDGDCSNTWSNCDSLWVNYCPTDCVYGGTNWEAPYTTSFETQYTVCRDCPESCNAEGCGEISGVSSCDDGTGRTVTSDAFTSSSGNGSSSGISNIGWIIIGLCVGLCLCLSCLICYKCRHKMSSKYEQRQETQRAKAGGFYKQFSRNEGDIELKDEYTRM